MKKTEQKKIVKDLCNGLRDEILENIQKGKIPESWDGVELRWLFSELAGRRVFGLHSRPREKEYHNTVIVNNL